MYLGPRRLLPEQSRDELNNVVRVPEISYSIILSDVLKIIARIGESHAFISIPSVRIRTPEICSAQVGVYHSCAEAMASYIDLGNFGMESDVAINSGDKRLEL